MKKVITFMAKGVTLLVLATLTGCGGGGSGPGAGATAGVSKGVITAKGSITINGVKFDTTGATIKIDDNPGTEADLKTGMIVKVKGTFDDRTGTATEIQFNDNLQGPITPGSIDPATKTFTVLGKTVRFEDNLTRVNDDTAKVFAGGGFADNKMVSVSGFEDNTGVIRAMRVDDSPNAEIELKGIVSALNPGLKTFTLTSGASSFTVNYTSIPASVVNSALVEVRGSLAASTITALANARGVTVEDALGAENEKVELEGLVTSGTSASFVINGVTVTTSGSTVFENGIAADLLPNVQVEAKGTIIGGVLVATKVSFRSNVRIEATVTAVNGTGTIGSLSLLGKTVATSNSTDFHSLANLAAITPNTTRVQVRGYLDLNNNIIATRIDTAGGGNDFIMGPVTAKDAAAGTVTLLATVISTDANTQYRDINDTPIVKSAFFALVSAGPAPSPFTVVKARIASGTLASQLEIDGVR